MFTTSLFGAKRSFLKSTGFLNVPGTTTSLAHCCAFTHVFVGRGWKEAGQLYVLCNVGSKGVGYAKDQAWQKSLMCFLQLKRGVYFDFELFGVGKNCLCWWIVLPKIFHVTSFTPKNEVIIGSCLVAECLMNLQFPWLHRPVDFNHPWLLPMAPMIVPENRSGPKRKPDRIPTIHELRCLLC